MRSFILLLISVSVSFAYTNLTPEQVHTRLAERDSLLLLDVREVSEYISGHIAEPDGMPVLTPANMPWSSGVLENHKELLPKDIDIIVYCKSGGRSAAASAYLEGAGFTRISNMTGGFNSWTYEFRTGGYGDHSGAWVHSDDDTVTIVAGGQESKLYLTGAALPEMDSVYIELQRLSAEFAPVGIVESDLYGFHKLTVLDAFGLPQFTNDSLALSETAGLLLYAEPNEFSSLPRDDRVSVFMPGAGWQTLEHELDGIGFHVVSDVLYTYYNLEGYYGPSAVNDASIPEAYQLKAAYPNPFNPITNIKFSLPVSEHVTLNVYNPQGQLVQTLMDERMSSGNHHVTFLAGSLASGIYFYQLQTDSFTQTRKFVLVK